MIELTKPLMPLRSNYFARVAGLWASGHISNFGALHNSLKSKLHHFLNLSDSQEISLFCNGTIALIAGIKALFRDLINPNYSNSYVIDNSTCVTSISLVIGRNPAFPKSGGEIITTPFTFPATTQAIVLAGFTPVFCDISDDDLNINPNLIKNLITENTVAICGVHIFGNLCQVNKIQQIADKYKLKVIYDAAHCFTPESAKHGDLVMHSFHATKIFHTIEGGSIISEPRTALHAESVANFGFYNGDLINEGLNGKMNEFQAGMGLEVLPLVARERVERFDRLQEYLDFFSDYPEIKLYYNKESLQYFVIRIPGISSNPGVSGRNHLFNELFERGIATRKYFNNLCCDLPGLPYSSRVRDSYLIANARKASEECLALPFYSSLNVSEVTGKLKTLLN
jgi:dTDP-4-amino-4,6-dideoxygalactose transaminase